MRPSWENDETTSDNITRPSWETGVTSNSNIKRPSWEIEKITQNVTPSKNLNSFDPFKRNIVAKGLSLPGLKINSTPTPMDYSKPTTINGKTFAGFDENHGYYLPPDAPSINDAPKMYEGGALGTYKRAREQFVNDEVGWNDFQAKHPLLAAAQQTLDTGIKRPLAKMQEGTRSALGGGDFSYTPDYIKGNEGTGSKVGDAIFNMAGNIIGYVGQPGMGGAGGAGSIGSGLTGLAKGTEYGLAKVLPKIASKPIINKAIQGAVESLPFSAQQASLGHMSPEETAKTFGINAGLGGAIGGGIGAFGKLKSNIAAKKLLANDTLKPISQEAVQPFNQVKVSTMRVPKPDIPIETTINKVSTPMGKKLPNELPQTIKKLSDNLVTVNELKDVGDINILKDKTRFLSDKGTLISGIKRKGGGVLLPHEGVLKNYNINPTKAMDDGLVRVTVNGNKKFIGVESKANLTKKQIETLQAYYPDYEVSMEITKLGSSTNGENVIAERFSTPFDIKPLRLPAVEKQFTPSTTIQKESLKGFEGRLALKQGSIDEIRTNDKGELVVFYKHLGKDQTAFVGLDGKIVGAGKIPKENFKPLTELNAPTITSRTLTPSTTIQKGLLPQRGSMQVGEPILSSRTLTPRGLKPQSNILGQELKAQTGLKPLGQDTISKVKTNTIAKTDMLTQVEKNMLDNKDFTYNVKSETNSIAEAQARLTSDFKGEVASLNSKETFSGVDIDSMFGVVESELKTARATGDYSQVHSMLKNTRKAGTTEGQAIQAFAKYSRTSEGSLVDAQRAVDGVEEGLKKTNPNLINKINTEAKQKIKDITDLGQTPDPEQIRDFVKKKYGLPTLSDGDIKNITDNMDKSKTFAEGSYDQNAYLTKARQIIADKVPATTYEKGRGLQRISLILNPKSLIARNPLGNTILGAAETVKDVPGALVDKLVSLKTGQRTTALNPFNKLKGQYEGFKQGISEFGKDIKLGVDTSPSRGQYELPSSRVFKNNTLNAIDQFERKALQLGDRPFYQAAYNGRISELKGLGRTIDESAHAEAKLYALDRVFQSNSNLSKGAKQIKEGINKIVPMLGDIAMPFTQTPANIMDKLLDYSPVGFAKSISQIGSIGKGTFNQKLFVDRIGRTLTGAGIGALGYTMAAKGVIVGQRNADTDVANFEQGLGKNPYAVKIGDHYYTFDWAQPISGLLAAGADAYQAGKDKKDFISSLGAAATAAGNTFVNQSFLQGVVTLMSGYSPVAGLTKTALSAPLQAAPTVGSNIAKLIDPYVRETYDPNPLKQTANRFVAKIPFASKTLPVKIDQSGQEIKQQQGVGTVQKALNLFINPSTSTTFRPDSTQKEILRLYSEGGTKIQVPTVVDKTISKTKDHPQVNLTPTEFTQYQKRTGQLTMEGFKSEIDRFRYGKAIDSKDKTADEKRADLLAAIIEQSKAQAKKEILKSRGYSK